MSTPAAPSVAGRTWSSITSLPPWCRATESGVSTVVSVIGGPSHSAVPPTLLDRIVARRCVPGTCEIPQNRPSVGSVRRPVIGDHIVDDAQVELLVARQADECLPQRPATRASPGAGIVADSAPERRTALAGEEGPRDHQVARRITHAGRAEVDHTH